MNNIISFGVIVAFIAYVKMFSSPLTQLAQSTTFLQSTAAASQRVFDFLDENEMSSQKELIRTLDKHEVEGKIDFEDVTFKYDINNYFSIKNFSINVKPHQKIVITGPIGAGKTTLANLLMKFYEINSGDIIIDGISINKLERENVHKIFTMVFQDTWLFNGTIKENIVYNRKNVTDEKVKEVCREIGLDDFINTLPNGYNTKISDKDNISAGQKQLITIARGMIEDAPILIFDEATSNLDIKTEEKVQKVINKLSETKTIFIIAHKLSTIRNADLIIFMDNGKIIEHGTHNELINKNGAYAKLYNINR